MSKDNAQKQQEIIQMFDQIAGSYDLTNRVLSLGIDRSWRKEAIKKALNLCLDKNLVIADIACGTGDMLMYWCENLEERKAEFIGIDPSEKMLEIAKKKLQNQKVRFHQSVAQDLSVLENESIDILSIAYGIRNVVDLDLAIREFSRVLKPNGILVILEFTQHKNQKILDRLMSFYTRKILPLIGGIVSKNYKAYAYLPNSIDGFLSSKDLIQKLEQYKLICTFNKSYSANISSLIICKKDI